MKLALKVAAIALLAAGLYYRFARQDAAKYYVLFGASALLFGIHVIRFGKNTK